MAKKERKKNLSWAYFMFRFSTLRYACLRKFQRRLRMIWSMSTWLLSTNHFSMSKINMFFITVTSEFPRAAVAYWCGNLLLRSVKCIHWSDAKYTAPRSQVLFLFGVFVWVQGKPREMENVCFESQCLNQLFKRNF